MSKIIISNDFNPNKLKYAEPKKNKHGSLSIWVQPKTIIQTPVMDCPFDVQVFEEEKTGNKTYSLSLSFRGMDEKPKLKNFHEKLVELDNKLIDDGVTNQKKWFKKKGFTKEVIKGAFYNPIVKVSMTDGEPDGKWIKYHDNGQIKYQRPFAEIIVNKESIPEVNKESIPDSGRRVKFIPYDISPKPLNPIKAEYTQFALEFEIEGTVAVICTGRFCLSPVCSVTLTKF